MVAVESAISIRSGEHHGGTLTSESEKSRAVIVILTQSLAKVCNSVIVNCKCMGAHHRSVGPVLGLRGGSAKLDFVCFVLI